MKKIIFILIVSLVFSFNSFAYAESLIPIDPYDPNIPDMNGDGKITSTDLAIMERILIGSTPITDSLLKKGDRNFDGRITSTDIALVTRILLGSLPISDFSLVKANNQFAIDFFKKFNQDKLDKNVFISPISMSMALSMLYQGANNSTKSEMSKLLGYDNTNITTVNSQYQKLLPEIIRTDSNGQLNIGNSIWVSDNFGVNEQFINTNKSVFNAEVNSIKFNDSGVEKINNWAAEKTSNKITKVLNKLDAQLMVILNAVYFKGNWKYQFVKKDTADQKFYKDDGTANTVKMMSYDPYKPIFYGVSSDFKALKMPYSDGKTSMYFVLPTTGTTNDFIANITLDKFNSIKSSIKETTKMNVQVPKFSILPETKSIKDTLISLGMKDAFEQGKADLNGIFQGSYVSDVLHNATIDIDEEGTVAAGTTSIIIMPPSIDAPRPESFILNKPFCYFIVDENSGEILFLGKSVDLKN